MTPARGRRIEVLIAAAAVTILSGVLGAQNPPPASFRARADRVSVDVSVRQRGRPVTGLTAADFELFDNGVPQQIAELGYETLPIDLTVALDISGSVTGQVLDQLRRSVRDLMRDLAPRDRLRLLTFNARISRLVDFGASPSAVDDAFGRIRPLGGTALLDALAVALAEPSSPDRRQLVVAFTDGEDQNSVTSHDELVEVVHRTTPTLGIVLASSQLRTGRSVPAADDRARQTYERLTKETGGFVESVDAGDSLAFAFRRVLADFRQSYILFFAPTGVEQSGFHTLDVRVRRNGVDVHARRGYTTGSAPTGG